MEVSLSFRPVETCKEVARVVDKALKQRGKWKNQQSYDKMCRLFRSKCIFRHNRSLKSHQVYFSKPKLTFSQCKFLWIMIFRVIFTAALFRCLSLVFATNKALDCVNCHIEEFKRSHPELSRNQNLFLAHKLWRTSGVFVCGTQATGGGVWC